jgi:hypothetical protein
LLSYSFITAATKTGHSPPTPTANRKRELIESDRKRDISW